MPQHIWSVLCYKASIDQVDNLVSLLDIPEKLAAQEEPKRIKEQLQEAKAQKKPGAIPVKLQLLTWWVRSDHDKPEKAKARLRLVPPSGPKPLPQEFSVDLEEHSSFRLRIMLQALPFPGFGRYWFFVELQSGNKWRRMAKIPLDLVQGKPLQSSDA